MDFKIAIWAVAAFYATNVCSMSSDNLSVTDNGTDFIRQTYLNMGVKESDLYIVCTFESRVILCKKLYRPVFDPIYGKCYLLDVNNFRRKHSLQGLTLILNLKTQEYPDDEEFAPKYNGLIMSIAKQHDPANVDTFFLSPYLYHKIYLEPQVEILNSTEQQCVDGEEGAHAFRYLKASYSNSACKLDCLMASVVYHCNCSVELDDMFLQHENRINTKFCHHSDESMNCVKKGNFENSNEVKRCWDQCKTPCITDRYHIQISSLPLNPKGFPKFPPNTTLKDFMYLTIKFNQLEYQLLNTDVSEEEWPQIYFCPTNTVRKSYLEKHSDDVIRVKKVFHKISTRHQVWMRSMTENENREQKSFKIESSNRNVTETPIKSISNESFEEIKRVHMEMGATDEFFVTCDVDFTNSTKIPCKKLYRSVFDLQHGKCFLVDPGRHRRLALLLNLHTEEYPADSVFSPEFNGIFVKVAKNDDISRTFVVSPKTFTKVHIAPSSHQSSSSTRRRQTITLSSMKLNEIKFSSKNDLAYIEFWFMSFENGTQIYLCPSNSIRKSYLKQYEKDVKHAVFNRYFALKEELNRKIKNDKDFDEQKETYVEDGIFRKCEFQSKTISCKHFYKSYMDVNYGKCFNFDFRQFNQIVPGEGLRLVMNLPTLANIPKENQPRWQGINMRFQNDLDPTYFDSILIPPKSYTQVDLVEQHIKLISSETFCNQDKDFHYKILNTTYSQLSCRLECLITAVMKYCNCVVTMDKGLLNSNLQSEFCSKGNDTQCMLEYAGGSGITQEEQYQCSDACLNPCDSYRYKPMVSSMVLNDQGMSRYHSSNATADELYVVDISFQNLEYEEIKINNHGKYNSEIFSKPSMPFPLIIICHSYFLPTDLSD